MNSEYPLFLANRPETSGDLLEVRDKFHGTVAARAFGLAFRVDAETYENLLGYGIDLEAASGEDHHLLPVPAVFLIGRDGTIDFRYYNPDYKERLSGDALLEAARKAKD